MKKYMISALALTLMLALLCASGAMAATHEGKTTRTVTKDAIVISNQGKPETTVSHTVATITYKYFYDTNAAGYYTGGGAPSDAGSFPVVTAFQPYGISAGNVTKPLCSSTVSADRRTLTIVFSGGKYTVTYYSRYVESDPVSTSTVSPAYSCTVRLNKK